MKNFLAFILLISNTVFAQVKTSASYSVYINMPECTIKASVLANSKKIKASDAITYFWYSQNAIHQTNGGYEGKLLSGAYTCFYLSNNLKEKGEFKNGYKTGKWMLWYPNGVIQEITHWKQGVKSGVHEKYDVNGKLILREEYKNNVLHGSQTSYAFDTLSAKKEFRKGVEVISVPKTAVAKGESKTPISAKIKKLFKKDEPKKSDEEKANTSAKKEQPQAKTVAVPKKTLKEKINALFKKKEKAPEKETLPKKDTSSKPSANK